MNLDRAIVTNSPGDLLAAQYPAMAEAGVESLRVSFIWATAQPVEDGPIDLSVTDDVVARAAAGRMRVLPVVIVAPEWARFDAGHALSPPRDPAAIRRYATALAERYGPRGSFWAEHPSLPPLPIRHWQFWNEIHFESHWRIPKSLNRWRSYVKRLAAFRKAIRAGHAGAQIVLAGLANRSWAYLESLYRAGAKRHFDVAAIHPFTKEPGGVLSIAGFTRRTMKRHDDEDRPLWITELNRPASDGKVEPDQDLDTTDAGMARWLAAAYRKLAARKSPVQRAYWYSWATEYSPLGQDDMFRFAGLFAYDGNDPPAARPAYDAFLRTARRLQGCSKTSTGLCR